MAGHASWNWGQLLLGHRGLIVGDKVGRPGLACLVSGPVGAGAAKADLKPGVSGCPQCCGQLVGVTTEKVHRLRPIKGQHYDQPVGSLHVIL